MWEISPEIENRKRNFPQEIFPCQNSLRHAVLWRVHPCSTRVVLFQQMDSPKAILSLLPFQNSEHGILPRPAAAFGALLARARPVGAAHAPNFRPHGRSCRGAGVQGCCLKAREEKARRKQGSGKGKEVKDGPKGARTPDLGLIRPTL